MQVAELTTLAQLEAISVQWHALALTCSHPTPYMLPAYMLPWLRRLPSRWALRFAAVWEGSTLLGLAPMMVRRVGGQLFGLRMLCSPEVAPTPPCEVLLHPTSVGPVTEALMAHWSTHSDWDAIELASVPAGAVCLTALASRAVAAGLEVRETEDLRFYCVPTQGGNWQSYHDGRSKKHRQNLRRGWRYFERIGATHVRVYPGDMDLQAVREATRHVVARSWKDDGGVQGWNQFVEEILDGFAAPGMLRASFLTVADEPVAYLYDVLWKNDVFAVQNGYSLAMQPGNPGQLLLAHSIRLAHESGAGRYVTGNRDYLRQWGEDTLDTSRLRIRRRSPASAARLALYDFVHRRRQRHALRAADEAKDERKRSMRAAGGQPEADS